MELTFCLFLREIFFLFRRILEDAFSFVNTKLRLLINIFSPIGSLISNSYKNHSAMRR